MRCQGFCHDVDWSRIRCWMRRVASQRVGVGRPACKTWKCNGVKLFLQGPKVMSANGSSVFETHAVTEPIDRVVPET